MRRRMKVSEGAPKFLGAPKLLAGLFKTLVITFQCESTRTIKEHPYMTSALGRGVTKKEDNVREVA